MAEVVPTEVYGLDHGLGEESPWRAAGLGAAGARTLDLGVVAGDLRDVRGDAIGVSRVVAHDGGLAVGDTISVRLADTAPRSLRVAAIYDRAAGLGDVVLDAAVARRHTVDPSAATVFVAGAPPPGARSPPTPPAAATWRSRTAPGTSTRCTPPTRRTRGASG